MIPVPPGTRQLIDTKTCLSGSPRDDQYLGFSPLPYRIVWVKQDSSSSAPLLSLETHYAVWYLMSIVLLLFPVVSV